MKRREFITLRGGCAAEQRDVRPNSPIYKEASDTQGFR
jgi:hypothetical protein